MNDAYIQHGLWFEMIHLEVYEQSHPHSNRPSFQVVSHKVATCAIVSAQLSMELKKAYLQYLESFSGSTFSVGNGEVRE